MAGLQEVGHEALCSAFYSLPFSRLLGERPGGANDSEVAYFRLCNDPGQLVSARQDPKQVTVEIRQDEDGLIVVTAGWLNLSGDTVAKGTQVFRIPTLNASEAQVRASTEQVVVRVLNIYTDVLQGTGVAGPIENIAPESEAGDPDDPDDMAVPE